MGNTFSCSADGDYLAWVSTWNTGVIYSDSDYPGNITDPVSIRISDTALVIVIAVMYRQNMHTYTATDAAAHAQEYVDMDKLAEHVSPARTADDTD